MGFSDIGFSSCTEPTYYPVSEYLGRELRFGFNAKGCSTEGRVPCKAMPEDFGVWGLAFV